MLGRFFSLDGGLTFLGLFVCGAAIATVAGAPGWAIGLAGVSSGVLLLVPVGEQVQEFLLGHYVDRGQYERALDLAHRIYESAPAKKFQTRARTYLALIQVARGDHRRAREHLELAAKGSLKSLERAVVDGHLACVLSHLGEELDRAEELADRARREVSDDQAALFDYFVGLVALRKGDAEKARGRIEASLAADDDDRDPSPGERRYELAHAMEKLGDTAGAREQFERAAQVRPESHFVRLARNRIRSGDLS